MITITIVRNDSDKRIVSFAVVGHAKYAKPGKDIVCAGVSTVSIGTVNAIETLAGVELPAKMKDGWLSSDIPILPDADADGRMQLLLESMVVMLETIAKSYGKYVVIHEQLR
ncbi:ribosomal-processing cysteine protease Prp [Paenibacillus sp. GSMTC-2017]|uniref:ribosomal-processing cysteine protease Prp n=1 Tax=Paenibacillus sp. GSMTC-2017 TaxID=2794350 RepID=UPI0018D80C3C|nr:ribosomal-processing cysteine protease Prp [Paenibacillus sp. GSMTC-2017]MBH5317147.1 ribosomal-processing cysteine protease Prp [Paenibacillus sp. GSMTC-2017]